MISFPIDLRPIIENFQTQEATTVSIRESLLAGKSGAFVALVDCRGKHDGVFVLKIGRQPQSYESEQSRHRKAASLGAFSGQIPTIVAQITCGERYLLLLRLAGDSRIAFHPLIGALNLFRSAYEQLARTLWTPAQFMLTEQISAAELIRTSLSYRLDPAQGGRIQSNVRAQLGPALLVSTHFAHLDEVFPNPIHFALHADMYPHPIIGCISGPVHGDCHAGNIFVKAKPDASITDLVLIDLAFFEERAPLFLDHAYFELATLLHKLDGIGEQRWTNLLAAIAEQDAPHLEKLDHQERAWASDLREARSAALMRAVETYPGRRDDTRTQVLVTSVIAGLVFLNKVPRTASGSGGLNPAQYLQSFLWASRFLKQLLVEAGVAITPVGTRIPTIGVQQTPAKHSLSNADWSRVGGFDSQGLNVLVLSPAARVSGQLDDILKLSWGLVIDLSTAPLNDTVLDAVSRPVRQLWPGEPDPDPNLLRRGTLWYFANGRDDLTDVPPTTSTLEWRRRYVKHLDRLLSLLVERVSPSKARTLFVAINVDPAQLRLLCESIDTAFSDILVPIVIGSDVETTIPDSVACVQSSIGAINERLKSFGEPTTHPPDQEASLPHRISGLVTLEKVPAELVLRVEKDLVLVYPQRAQLIPADRAFGLDFLRGMIIDWSELAHNLDVERELFSFFQQQIKDALEASTNATINLLHEPSAGGTTLSRRIAWSFRESYPVVVIEQVTADTNSYLREIFQRCGLPLLVVMEAETITESAREALLRQLREDNTRAVFLWVSRVYGDSFNKTILPGRLSVKEATTFLNSYLGQVTDLRRRNDLTSLANDPRLADQRSPFFFGLVAFGEKFVGLERLIADTLEPLSEVERSLVAALSLVNMYSSEGFPADQFDELCERLNGGKSVFPPRSLFVVRSGAYLKIPHRLIAHHALIALSRKPEEWRADLHQYAANLLANIRLLRHPTADRLRTMIDALFFTRDTAAALEGDTDVQAGGISRYRRFSPLIQDIGSVEIVRRLLSKIVGQWPREPHYAVHYARHLLYEEPREIERAIVVAGQAEATEAGARDSAVVHMVGMCYRLKMEAQLRDAKENAVKFAKIADAIEPDFRQATEHFLRAIDLEPSSEYGLVATIQTVAALLKAAVELSGATTLAAFFRDCPRWCIEALSLAEEHIGLLRQRPHLALSLRAQRAIAEWGLVYGNKIESVVAQLRVLAKSHEEPGVRRALCDAIVAQYSRRWHTIPQSDLRTIELMMQRNIEQQGARDVDIRSWLKAYRHLNSFNLEAAVERLIDWHGLSPSAVEPAFYLHVFYFLRWINSTPRNAGYAIESNKWLDMSKKNRAIGQRAWSYEWLCRKDGKFHTDHFMDLTFDPVSTVRGLTPEHRKRMDARLARVEGAVRDYRGPQQASLDLGHGLRPRFTPLDKVFKDDEGRRVSLFLSFTYDGPVGWDPQRI